MPALRKTAELEAQFEIAGNRVREIVRQMRAVEPAGRRRNSEVWKTEDIVRSFCHDLLCEDAGPIQGDGCPFCGG